MPVGGTVRRAAPFELTREGDQLRGRGTTDCLGHVALLALLFQQLALHRPKLKRTVVGVRGNTLFPAQTPWLGVAWASLAALVRADPWLPRCPMPLGA